MPLVPHCHGTVWVLPGSEGRFWKIGATLPQLVRYFLLSGVMSSVATSTGMM